MHEGFLRGTMFLLILALVLTAGVGQTVARNQTAPKPIKVFDGKTFAGWEGDRAIFRIQYGAIVGGSLERKVARNEFFCTTKTYGDFELRLKVKLLGGEGANAGI